MVCINFDEKLFFRNCGYKLAFQMIVQNDPKFLPNERFN